MPRAWRIVKQRHIPTAFDGEGARLYGGRWNSPGTAVVYLSESRALAALEVLAGLRSISAASTYALFEAQFKESLVEAFPRAQLPERWRESPPSADTQAIGDLWIRDRRSVLLRVPSVLVPHEFNYLLNPAHPAFDQVQIGDPQPLDLDPRLQR